MVVVMMTMVTMMMVDDCLFLTGAFGLVAVILISKKYDFVWLDEAFLTQMR